MVINKDSFKTNNGLSKEASPYYLIKGYNQSFAELVCDSCKSTHIIDTTQGYVCGSCGLVLEVQNIKFNGINFSDFERYAKLGKTHIGTKKERMVNGHSIKLKHLERLHSIIPNEIELQMKAKIEISRIISHLNLPNKLELDVYHKFIKIRSALSPGTKYRIPERLVPLCIYLVCKVRNISINETELLDVSKITKKHFNAFKLQIQHILPQYKERDRKAYVLQKILEIAEHFELGMPFYFQSKKILYRLWDNIKNTKDEVIAGLITSVLVLCSYQEKNKELVNVHKICEKLGIKMSTIQSQVKRRIFGHFKVEGFTTLIKSTDLLKKIMDKLGLIENIIQDLGEKESLSRLEKLNLD